MRNTQQHKRQRNKNLALAGALLGLAVLKFLKYGRLGDEQ